MFLSLALSLLFFYSCSFSILLMFQGIKLFSLQSACADNPCNNNTTCQSGFTEKGFRCLCTTGFKGPRCKEGNPTHVKPVVSSCRLQFYTQPLKAPVKVQVRFITNSHNNQLFTDSALESCSKTSRLSCRIPRRAHFVFSHLIFTSAKITF